MNNNGIIILRNKRFDSWPLGENRTGIGVFQALQCSNRSSKVLVKLIGWRIEAQLHEIWPEFWFAMDELKLQAAAKRHGFSWIYVQSCSMMLPNDELIKRMWSYVRKLRENFERKFQEFGSRSEKVIMVLQKQLWFVLYTPS